MPSPRVVLIGPPGSGKSTVAAALGDILGIPVRDTDDDIVAGAGRDIPTIFIEGGEEEFRRLERSAVVQALGKHDGVLALGGGAILDAQTRRDLESYSQRGGSIAYLSVSLAAAAPRVGLDAARPLLVGSPRAKWNELMDERRAIYEGLATIVVVTDEGTPLDAAKAIAEAMT